MFAQANRTVLWPRVVFGLIAVVAVLDVYIATRFAEPFPSLIMPSFAGDNVRNGQVCASTPKISVIFRDSRTASMTSAELMGDMPEWLVPQTTNWLFARSELQQASLSPVRQWVYRYISPGYGNRVRRARGELLSDQGIKDWLKYRIVTNFPGRAPVRLVVDWFTDCFNLKAAHPAVVEKPETERAVDLE